jgi:hypothetical protein
LWDPSQEPPLGPKYQPQSQKSQAQPEKPQNNGARGQAGEKGGRQEEVGMAFVKWVGFALVATALAVLPFTIWVSNRWAIVSATAGVVGIALLGVALAGRREDR